MKRLLPMALFVFATPLASTGCVAPDLTGPDASKTESTQTQRRLAPTSTIAKNLVTTDAWSVPTAISQIHLSNEPLYDGSGNYYPQPAVYEIRLYYVGYTTTMATIVIDDTDAGRVSTPVTYTNVGNIAARMRSGSNDHISVSICARTYQYYAYQGCDGFDNLLILTAADNGVPKSVFFPGAIPSANRGANTFTFTLNWTPVSIQPVYVKINEPIVSLSLADGLAKEITASALDADWRYIPGVPVSWSSSNTSVFTIDAYGRATPRGLGTATATATVAGLSSSVQVDVTDNNPPLTVTINASTSGVGGTSYFDANESGYGTQPYTYEWTVDGQSNGGGRSTYYTFWSSGVHTVAVQITDSAGRTAQASIDVNVF